MRLEDRENKHRKESPRGPFMVDVISSLEKKSTDSYLPPGY